MVGARRWVAMLVGLGSISCGPSVVDGQPDSSATMGASDTSEPTATSGIDSTSSTGPSQPPSMTTATTITTTASTSDTDSSTGGEPGAPVCIVHDGFNIFVDPAHHADVDGNGVPELWAVNAFTEPPTVERYEPALEEAVLTHWYYVDGVGFGFADIDGDGHDDLLADEWGFIRRYPGQPDGSLSFASDMLVVDGDTWSFTLADVDGDGDDDLFRFVPGFSSSSLELLGNDNGVFMEVSTEGLPEAIDSEAEIVQVRPLESGQDFALELQWEVDGSNRRVLAVVRLNPGQALIDEIYTTDVGYYRTIGEADVDGDGQLDLLAQGSYDEGPAIVILTPGDGGVLSEQVLLDDAAYAAVGDFEGTGTRQLLYRFDDRDDGPWPMRIYRFDEGNYGEVLDDPAGAPVFLRAFDYDQDGTDEIYVEYCEFGCYAGMAELVPCP